MHRTRLGLSQERLAEIAGVHPTYIGLVERNRRVPSLGVADSIAQALGSRLSKLMGEAEKIQMEGLR
ncbi:MAG: helix-turn-helix transcriptional regulator [Akkermansiaceae bacterium]|nr:helix-turn-helix transcriptional regulator [Akkermansiaceae bacterium]